MKFKYKALVAGGRYDNPWEKEVEVEAETIGDALTQIQNQFYNNEEVLSIERVD